jgi:hypothetical protein
LTNGALADAAFREGFRVILIRDRLFGMSARRVLAASAAAEMAGPQ